MFCSFRRVFICCGSEKGLKWVKMVRVNARRHNNDEQNMETLALVCNTKLMGIWRANQRNVIYFCGKGLMCSEFSAGEAKKWVMKAGDVSICILSCTVCHLAF